MYETEGQGAEPGVEMGPSVFDLYCGVGGISHGFRQAGARIIGAMASAPGDLATYKLNFPDAACMCAEEQSDEPLLRRVCDAASHADVLVGRPPLPSFSSVGLAEPRQQAGWSLFVEVLRELVPKGFLVVAPPVLATSRAAALFGGSMEEALALDGTYDVVSVRADAADFGVPQRRSLLLVFGTRNGSRPVMVGTDASSTLKLSQMAMSGGTPSDSPIAGAMADPWDSTVVSVEDAIGDLTFLKSGRTKDTEETASMPSPRSAYQDAMREDSRLLDGLRVPRIRADLAAVVEATPPGGQIDDPNGRRRRWHRLHPRYWAPALTDPMGVFHYDSVRRLSTRELARLQSFPDSFLFRGAKQRQRVCWAPPPLLAKAAALALMEAPSGWSRS